MLATDELVKEALAKPSDYAWWGDDKYFVTWGLCGPVFVENSGEALNQSNYEVIRDDLKERFPQDVEEIPQSHWAVGPITQLGIRVLDDDGIPTECFEAVLEWRERLEAYPVADEEHYSELEWNDFVKYVEGYARYGLPEGKQLRDDLPEDWAGQIASWIMDEHSISRVDDMGDDGMMGVAAQELGFTEDEEA